MIRRKMIRIPQNTGKPMYPRLGSNSDFRSDLFQVEHEAIIDLKHSLVRLTGKIEWAFLGRQLGSGLCETNGSGVADGGACITSTSVRGCQWSAGTASSTRSSSGGASV